MKQPVDPYDYQNLQGLDNDSTFTGSKASEASSEANNEQFFTLESNPSTDSSVYSSHSAVSISTNRRSPFTPHYTHSCTSDFTSGSPVSWSSGINDEERSTFWALKNGLLGPESDNIEYRDSFSANITNASTTRYSKILEMAHNMDLKQLLIACAEILSEDENTPLSDREAAVSAVKGIMDILGNNMVSVSGEPLQRLGAYMLEGLRARLLSSGSIIDKRLKCKEPTAPELMSYMQVLYQICPYYKFAYLSSNVLIQEAMECENRIHIIDFQIAQGSQWVPFIQSFFSRPGGPPFIRITGVDDSDSSHARGGGLELVSQMLGKIAESCGVPFQFHSAAISQLENLWVQRGEALAVNFPYILHHMPDESVSVENHRDRLLRLVKSLSPKIMTLVEQESNTNTGDFLQRFRETLDYYTAMFESIDAACPRDDKQRISVEEHCLVKDVVNMIACEGSERVERHEPFGKWIFRLSTAGFSQIRLGSSVSGAVRDMLREYSPNYSMAEANGALYLGWKSRALATCSAWR